MGSPKLFFVPLAGRSMGNLSIYRAVDPAICVQESARFDSENPKSRVSIRGHTLITYCTLGGEGV